MENLIFQKFTRKNEDALIIFLTAQRWPFHVGQDMLASEIQDKIIAGYYDGSGIETYLIMQNSTPQGFIRMYDLRDDTPLFDLRIIKNAQGRGMGTKALLWLTTFIFDNYPKVRRIEGYTREDNVAMQNVFQKCGFTKEAQHREAWLSEEGKYLDSVGYGILRRERQHTE
jgi:RimJ/RimL family protein N-acetyltransferase